MPIAQHRDHAASHLQHHSRPLNQRRAMRDNNARCAHIGNSLGDGVLVRLIEIGRALIKKQRVRLAVKRTGEQDTLALTARQCRAHITDQAGIAHRHRGDLLMHPRDTGAILDPGHI